MRAPASVVPVLVLTACVVSFPIGHFRSYGATYDLSSSKEGLVALVRGIAGRQRISTNEERDAAENVTITTYYLSSGKSENGRRELRVSYKITITQVGRREDRHQILTISCRVESRGIHEETWQIDDEGKFQQACHTPFIETLARELAPIVRAD